MDWGIEEYCQVLGEGRGQSSNRTVALIELTPETIVNVMPQPPPRAFVHTEIDRQQTDRQESLSGGVQIGMGDCSRLSGVDRMGAPADRGLPAAARPGGASRGALLGNRTDSKLCGGDAGLPRGGEPVEDSL
jgi:hypothetical protein